LLVRIRDGPFKEISCTASDEVRRDEMAGGIARMFNRIVIIVLLGAFALLLIEVRYLHDEVLKEHRISWTPIVYSGVVLVAGILALFFWDRGGRRLLFWVFAPALVIGPVGWWFHNDGQPWQGLKRELAVWAHPLGGESPTGHEGHAEGARSAADTAAGDDVMEGSGGPPALAPLMIAGLGLLGMLACARRFQPETVVPPRE
jgi:hypothetical protein